VTESLSGHCSGCGQTIPATPAPEPYRDKVRLAPHPHPVAEWGPCIGGRQIVRPLGEVQLWLFGEAGKAA
jgi:hypothetical protein